MSLRREAGGDVNSEPGGAVMIAAVLASVHCRALAGTQALARKGPIQQASPRCWPELHTPPGYGREQESEEGPAQEKEIGI